jgi:two-component system, sensor histidine kinase PdtaS
VRPTETSQTILLVEDDAIIALAQKALLEEHGYTVLAAATGAAAVETALGNESVDLVLTDIDLGPGIDGTEAAAAILEGRDVPIVFLTNHSEKEMVDKVKGITQYGYVLKYSGEFVLLETLRMAFELFRARKEAEGSRDLYRSIVRLSGEIVIRHAPDQRWVFVNRAACEFWGKTAEELLETGHLSFVHPDDRSATEAMTRKMVETREPVWGFVNRQLTPGGWRTVEWNRAPIIDESGHLAGYQASGRDITERHRATHLPQFQDITEY